MIMLEDWGRLYSLEGEYIRLATQKEWVESYSLNKRWATMGYIPITTADEGGEPITIYACVVGGPTRENDI